MTQGNTNNYSNNGYVPQGNPQANPYMPQMNSFVQQAAPVQEKKGRSKVFVAAMIVSIVALVAVMTVFAIHFVNKNVKKGKDKKKHVYTVEDVKELYGYDEVYTREYDSEGITYTMCYPENTGSSRAIEYHLIYIFDSVDDASQYFESMRTSYFRNITGEGVNYVEGWISGICDADEKDRAELKDNLIVIDELEFIGYDF